MIMKKFVPRVLVVVALLTSWLGASVADSASSWEDFQCGDLRQKTLASKVQDGSAYDVVILGGDPSGVAAAKSAADKGAKVLLLSESSLFGGAIANGLSATDLGSVAASKVFPVSSISPISGNLSNPTTSRSFAPNSARIRSNSITLPGFFVASTNLIAMIYFVTQLIWRNQRLPSPTTSRVVRD